MLWNPAFVSRICTWEFTLFCLFKAYLCLLKHIFTNPKLTCAICAMTQNVLYEVSTVPEKTSIEKCTTLNDPVNIFYRIKKKWKETLFVWGKRKYPHQVSPLPQFKRIDCEQESRTLGGFSSWQLPLLGPSISPCPLLLELQISKDTVRVCRARLRGPNVKKNWRKPWLCVGLNTWLKNNEKTMLCHGQKLTEKNWGSDHTWSTRPSLCIARFI